MNTGKLIVGLAAGIAVGAALGVLFAPDKGTNTRRRIRSKSEELAENLADKFTDLMDTMTDKFENLKADASHMADKAEQKIKEEKAVFEAAVNK